MTRICISYTYIYIYSAADAAPMRQHRRLQSTAGKCCVRSNSKAWTFEKCDKGGNLLNTTTDGFNTDLVLSLLAVNCCSQFCVILSRLCMIAILATLESNRHNDKAIGSGEKLSIFLTDEVSVDKAQVVTALGCPYLVKQATQRNKSMLRYRGPS